MKIFLDMDGVLSDFEGCFRKHTGYDFLESDPNKWRTVGSIKGFWEFMPWMPDGKELWNAVKFLKQLTPTILTAPTFNTECKSGKLAWCKRELGAKVPVIIEKIKEKYASPDGILIDDRTKNIDAWKAAGGIGILHTSAAQSLSELNGILQSYTKRIETRITPPAK